MIVDAFVSNGTFERFGGFVVELLELRLESSFNEILLQAVVRA
jgi:hypothetical protein